MKDELQNNAAAASSMVTRIDFAPAFASAACRRSRVEEFDDRAQTPRSVTVWGSACAAAAQQMYLRDLDADGDR